MLENLGDSQEHEAFSRWPDLDDLYGQVHLKGEQSAEFLFLDGDTLTLRLYLRYRPYNLWIGQPLFPEQSQGIAYWIQITAPADSSDIPRELYAALETEDNLFRLAHADKLQNVGKRKTEEVLNMIREGTLLPFSEFTDETG